MIETALGNGGKEPVLAEQNISEVARRSLFINRNLDSGEVIGKNDIIALRPAVGIPPNLTRLLVGKRTNRRLKIGDILEWSDLT